MANIKINNLDNSAKDKLRNSQFYKLDFGIDEENSEKMELLILIAYLSGFSAIDISANKELIDKAIDSINKAKQKSYELNMDINQDILLCASLGINLFKNLNDDEIINHIGLLKHKNINIIDIHFNETSFLSNTKYIDLILNCLKDKIISVNISRKKLSNANIINLLKILNSYSKNNLIIEVEGLRYYKDDFSQILQTISTADIINKQFKQKSPKYRNIPLILGNSFKGEIEKLAVKCDVPFNGININSGDFNEVLRNKSPSISNEEIKSILIHIKDRFIKSN